MTAEQRILKRMVELEKAEGGVSRFAERLGLHPGSWVSTRNGGRRLGNVMAAAAARAYPELEPDVLVFLRYELPERKRKERVCNKSA